MVDRTQGIVAEWASDPEHFEWRAAQGAMPMLDRARWQALAPALAEARQRVAEDAAVDGMREVSLELRARADFDDKFEAIETDPALSAVGRAERRAAVAGEQHVAVAKVLAGFDRQAGKLLEAFPLSEVPAVAPEVFPRLSFSVVRARDLSPAEFVDELGAAIERKDVALARALLPLARSFRERPDYVKVREQTRVEQLPALEDVIARGEGLLVSSDELAHHLASAVVARLRFQRDELVAEIQAHGSLRRSPRARFVDEDGRPTLARDLVAIP